MYRRKVWASIYQPLSVAGMQNTEKIRGHRLAGARLMFTNLIGAFLTKALPVMTRTSFPLRIEQAVDALLKAIPIPDKGTTHESSDYKVSP